MRGTLWKVVKLAQALGFGYWKTEVEGRLIILFKAGAPPPFFLWRAGVSGGERRGRGGMGDEVFCRSTSFTNSFLSVCHLN